MAVQNLGQIGVFFKGTSEPSNTDLVWLDTNTSPGVFKTYDPNVAAWVAQAGGLPFEEESDLANETATSTLTFTIQNQEATYQLITSRRNTNTGDLVVANFFVHVSGASSIDVSPSFGGIVNGSFGIAATTRPTSTSIQFEVTAMPGAANPVNVYGTLIKCTNV